MYKIYIYAVYTVYGSSQLHKVRVDIPLKLLCKCWNFICLSSANGWLSGLIKEPPAQTAWAAATPCARIVDGPRQNRSKISLRLTFWFQIEFHTFDRLKYHQLLLPATSLSSTSCKLLKASLLRPSARRASAYSRSAAWEISETLPKRTLFSCFLFCSCCCFLSSLSVRSFLVLASFFPFFSFCSSFPFCSVLSFLPLSLSLALSPASKKKVKCHEPTASWPRINITIITEWHGMLHHVSTFYCWVSRSPVFTVFICHVNSYPSDSVRFISVQIRCEKRYAAKWQRPWKQVLSQSHLTLIPLQLCDLDRRKFNFGPRWSKPSFA